MNAYKETGAKLNSPPVKPFGSFRQKPDPHTDSIPEAPNVFSWPLKVFLGLCIIFIMIAVYFFITGKRGGGKINSPLLIPSPTVSAFKAKVQYLDGLAWKDEAGQMKQLKEADIVAEKDKLITGENSRMVLVFDEGSVVRIGEKTGITLVRLSHGEMRINENEGELFASVQKTPNRRFFIEAGEVTVESLGTVFSVENKGEVKVNVFDHSVRVSVGTKEKEIGKKEQWQQEGNTVAVLKDSDYKNNKFLNWSLLEEAKNTVPGISPSITAGPSVIPTEIPSGQKPLTSSPQPKSQGILSLEGKMVNGGVVLNWKTVDLDSSKGFKLMKSLSENPVYPSGDYVFFESEKSNSFFWEIKDGKKWHFRVCQFLPSGSCGVYSNDLVLEAPTGSVLTETNSSGNVTGIKLTGEKSGVLVKLSWTVDGYSSLGYKVVWSSNSQPVYPSRDGDSFHYYSDPGKRSDEISNMITGKTYYFRVCDYQGAKCGIYSNELSFSF